MGFHFDHAKVKCHMLKRFAAGNLGTTERVVISCGLNQRVVVHSIWLCNTHSGTVNYTFHHIPSGQTVGIKNALAYNTVLRSSSTDVYDTKIYMEPGDTVTAYASASGHIAMFVYADVVDQ